MRPRILIALHIIVSVASVAVCAPLHNEEASSLDSESSKRGTNWLTTQNWLIDSINRLQRELNEVSTSITGHLDASDAESQSRQRAFVHDVAVLRADHTILSQQQQRIIQLIKERTLRDSDAAASNDNQDGETKDEINVNARKSVIVEHRAAAKHKRRPFVRAVKKFEAETKQNITEVFAELKAQHDITLALFDDLRDLEMRLAKQVENNS